jgi:hypothetical protein
MYLRPWHFGDYETATGPPGSTSNSPAGHPRARRRRPFPQTTAAAERAKVTPAAAQRLVGLVTAAWTSFDEIAAASPAELGKGPRVAAGTGTS